MTPARAVLPLLLVGLLADPTAAYVPDPAPVARAAAKRNVEAKRAQTLYVQVAIRAVGAEAPTAHGTLLAAPDARARLEVRHERGFVERQLRRSGGLSAARDARLLDQPRPLLPPLWILQARSGADLLARLGELGGNPTQLHLGYDGDHDCYVLGSRGGPSIWVDQDTLAVVRIDVAGGVTYRMGPVPTDAEGIALPAWIEVEAPGGGALRLELGSASAFAPAAGSSGPFRPEWLTAAD